MEDVKMQQEKSQSDALYSGKEKENKEQEDYKAKLEKEFNQRILEMKAKMEDEAKKSSMSELELAKTELEEWKKKYQEKENECLISKQKEETTALLNQAGLSIDILDVVYVPLDMNKTKENIDKLKNYINQLEKAYFGGSQDTPIPRASKEAGYDPFIEGFETKEL